MLRSSNNLKSPDRAQLVTEQVSILHELVHRNVVNIYQFYPKDPQYSYIVLEFMAGGELFERIIKKVLVECEACRVEEWTY